MAESATRTKACIQCGETFEYQVGRGTDRALCSDFCRTKRRHALSKTKALCVTPGCKNPRGYSSGICNSCYYRIKRTGTVVRRAPRYRSLGTNGYVNVFDKTHPLAHSSGQVYEHRLVLHAAIGDGDHACHWCGRVVKWKRWKKGEAGNALVADHLDGDKSNNEVSNLVPSCNSCNANRGLFMSWVKKHKDDPVLWSMYEQAKAEEVKLGHTQ